MTSATRADRDRIRRFRTSGMTSKTREPVALAAGPTTLLYEGAALRVIAVRGSEAVQRVYFALRDRNWDTVDGVVTNERIKRSRGGFEIAFDCRHECGSVGFAWHGEIRGGSDGTVCFRCDGRALTAFSRNRIGICVLHPMSLAGSPCRVIHDDGTAEPGRFPDLISPHQPFKGIRAIEYDVSSGSHVSIEFEGDLFEMEDQRNWTDASFKTYSTPLALPFPVEVKAGALISQSVTIRPSTALPTKDRTGGSPRIERARHRPGTVEISVDPAGGVPLPDLGFVLSQSGGRHSATSMERLRALNPAHLRCDLRPGVQSAEQISDALGGLAQFEAPAELAVFIGESPERDLADVARALAASGVVVGRVLVFERKNKSTSSTALRAAREMLSGLCPQAGFCGGTDAFFAELNRERPDVSALDGLSYSVTPQVHAFDNRTLVESLAAQTEACRSARAFAGSRSIHVSPVSFRMRWNPNATAPEESIQPAGLPAGIDARQLSSFGAAWTAGSIKALSIGGAASVTYYETIGALGLMDEPSASAASALFPCVQGGVFPLYHVFRALAPCRNGRAFHTRTDHPMMADALAAGSEAVDVIAVFNYASKSIRVHLRGLTTRVHLRTLAHDGYEDASKNPEGFYHTSEATRSSAHGLDLAVPAYGIVFCTTAKEGKEGAP